MPECSCGGMNPDCFKCFGTGHVGTRPRQWPTRSPRRASSVRPTAGRGFPGAAVPAAGKKRHVGMPSVQFEIHGSPRLQRMGWEALLRAWREVLDETTAWLTRNNDRKKDVPYWYGERALTGLLSVASWRVGNRSLEEFTGERQARGRKDRRFGRGDLWLDLGSDRFTIEAKVVWPMGTKGAITAVRDALEAAHNQLGHLKSDFRLGLPMAVCYAVPWLSKDGRSNIPEKVTEIFTRLRDEFKDGRTIVATYQEREPIPGIQEHHFPGLIFIGRYWKHF